MKRIVIDTNVYSFLCLGRDDVAKLLFENDVVYVPSVVLGELEAGFRKGNRYLWNKTSLERFLSIESVRVANVDMKVAEMYGKIHLQLKNDGAMIPINDVWIASTAMAFGAALVTYDTHFTKIEGLNLILKTVGT